MCYSATAIANFFIEKALKLNSSVYNMHLQKMVFFAHAAYFKQTNRPLFSDPVVAWQHGPVVETLYHELKRYGTGNIKELIAKYDFQSCKLVVPVVGDDNQVVIEFLNSVWEKLSQIDTWRLRALSHAKGGAWFKTVQSQGIDPENDEDVRNRLPRNLTILDSVIRECGR